MDSPSTLSELRHARTLLTGHHRAPLLAWSTVCIAALLSLALPLPYLSELQASDLELMLRLRQAIRPVDTIPELAFVTIDAAAERVAGQPWPWDKAQVARALKALRAEGARTVVLACLFRDAPLRTLTAADPLGQEIAKGGAVIVPARPGLDLAGVLSGSEETAEIDGMVQRVRVWETVRSAPRLTWSGHALAKALDSGTGRIVVGAQHPMAMRDGWLRVNPAMRHGLRRASLAAVLAGTLERDFLKDRVVILGVTGDAAPALQLTPGQTVSPAELHALAVATGLTGTGLKRTAPIVTALLVLLTLCYTVPIVWAPRARRALMIAKVGTLFILAPVLALIWLNVEVDVARPIVMFLIALPATAALRLGAREQRGPAIAQPRDAASRRDENRAAAIGAGAGADEPVMLPPAEPVDQDLMLEMVVRFLGGRYERMSTLGHGGMGTVLKAYCKRLGTDVALKVMHPQHNRSPQLVERFYREYELGERLVHPGFVRVFERGHTGLHFFSMELVEGRTLKDDLDDGIRLTWRQGARLLAEMAGALRFAHGLGVLHRDLKPGNVMRTGGGAVKVLDLGVARVDEGAALTGSGEVMGTLRYMAPEQIEGAMDVRTDIFSAAVVVWEVCTGELPYDPYDITRRPPAEPPAVSEPADLDVVQLLKRCMAFDPDARPADFAAVMAELNKFETSCPSRS